MKRRFRLKDGTVGMLDTDTGDFTPGETAHVQPEQAGGQPQFPMPGYENVPAEPGLTREDPIGDVIVGNAVAGGLPKLIEAAGARLGAAGANATTRLATRTAEEEAARVANASSPKAPVSPVRKIGDALGRAVDLHHPLKPAMSAVARMAETPLDRLFASPTIAKAASMAQSGIPGTRPGAYLLYLLGHGLSDDAPAEQQEGAGK